MASELCKHFLSRIFQCTEEKAWVGAVGRGQGQLVGAERGAAHGTVHTGALVFAAHAETLAVLVHPAAKLAATALQFGCVYER